MTEQKPPIFIGDIQMIDISAYKAIVAERDELHAKNIQLHAENERLREASEKLALALDLYAMVNQTFPEYGDVARLALAEYRAQFPKRGKTPVEPSGE
jgi:hypothetical protein